MTFNKLQRQEIRDSLETYIESMPYGQIKEVANYMGISRTALQNFRNKLIMSPHNLTRLTEFLNNNGFDINSATTARRTITTEFSLPAIEDIFELIRQVNRDTPQKTDLVKKLLTLIDDVEKIHSEASRCKAIWEVLKDATGKPDSETTEG